MGWKDAHEREGHRDEHRQGFDDHGRGKLELDVTESARAHNYYPVGIIPHSSFNKNAADIVLNLASRVLVLAAPILVVPVPRYSDCLREHGPALCAVVQVLPGHGECARADRRVHPGVLHPQDTSSKYAIP